jgi:hypothetical protein
VYIRSLPFVLLTSLLFGACSRESAGGPDEDTISREAFVQAYVDLRAAALADPRVTISLEERDRILRDAGLTEEDLLRFAEVHGPDVQLMKEVWEEVDTLIQARREPPDDPERDAR